MLAVRTSELCAILSDEFVEKKAPKDIFEEMTNKLNDMPEPFRSIFSAMTKKIMDNNGNNSHPEEEGVSEDMFKKYFKQ